MEENIKVENSKMADINLKAIKSNIKELEVRQKEEKKKPQRSDYYYTKGFMHALYIAYSILKNNIDEKDSYISAFIEISPNVFKRNQCGGYIGYSGKEAKRAFTGLIHMLLSKMIKNEKIVFDHILFYKYYN